MAYFSANTIERMRARIVNPECIFLLTKRKEWRGFCVATVDPKRWGHKSGETRVRMGSVNTICCLIALEGLYNLDGGVFFCLWRINLESPDLRVHFK